VIERHAHGDVTRYTLSARRSRALGYPVSVYLTRRVVTDTGVPEARRGAGGEWGRA
jgi:hypothetical protein